MSIDYGHGLTNIDHETGIRYGIINMHSVNPDALQDVYDNGDNLTYKAAVDDAKSRLVAAIRPILADLGVLPYDYRNGDRTPKADAYLNDVIDSLWEDIEQDWNDQYTEDNDTYRYEQDGYVLETSSFGLFVIKSPFYTFAAFCSPCVPGAGDLDHTKGDGAKAYCLGHDWFDDSEAPYPVYRVDTHARVTE